MRIDSFYLDREISNSTKWSTECPLLVHHSDRCASLPVVRVHRSINHSYGGKGPEWLLWVECSSLLIWLVFPATLTAAKSFFNGGSSSRPPDPSSSKSYAAIVEKKLSSATFTLKSPISHQGEPDVCFTYDEIYRSVDPLRFSLIESYPQAVPL